MADEPHKHEWEDAWGADCVVCHVDLIGYAESAQERITTLETQYAAAMAIVRAVKDRGVYFTLQNGRHCYFCEAETETYTGEPPHKADCPVTKARALLAEESEAE